MIQFNPIGLNKTYAQINFDYNNHFWCNQSSYAKQWQLHYRHQWFMDCLPSSDGSFEMIIKLIPYARTAFNFPVCFIYLYNLFFLSFCFNLFLDFCCNNISIDCATSPLRATGEEKKKLLNHRQYCKYEFHVISFQSPTGSISKLFIWMMIIIYS